MASIKTVTTKIVKGNKDTINQIIGNQLIFGTITAIKDEEDNPRITVKVDSKYEVVEGASLLISSLCKPPILEDGLQVGDRVRMLSLNNNQIAFHRTQVL